MLPQPNRLKKKKDFEKAFKEGKNWSQDFLFLKVKKNDLEESRFGLVVSKKVSKKAVVRNKLKRRLREIIRKRLPEIKKGIDGVIVIKPGFPEDNFEGIEKKIEKLFKKARII